MLEMEKKRLANIQAHLYDNYEITSNQMPELGPWQDFRVIPSFPSDGTQFSSDEGPINRIKTSDFLQAQVSA
jgi:hypothetical protein